ncbi:MAG: GAF and ANTAR domain-containing protein [Jiangellales bacterium]
MGAQESRSVEALIQTIDSLQRELEGMRTAARLRAVIEQAMGVLVERDALTLEQAFDRLRRLSQEQNAPLVDVAATILGITVPVDDPIEVDEAVLPSRLHATDETSPQWRALREHPRARQGSLGVAVEALAGASTGGDDAAHLLVELLSPARVAAALLFSVVEDGSLELRGQYGYPPDATSAWRRIPLSLDLPLTRAVNDGTPVFLGSVEARHELFPSLTREQSQFQALAVIPVWDGGRRIGCIGLAWVDEQAFDDAKKQRVLTVIRRAGAMMLRNASADDPDRELVAAVMHVVTDPWLVLVPAGESRAFFMIESVSPQVKGGDTMAGQRLLAAYPGAAADQKLLDELDRLVKVGGRFVRSSQSAGVTTAPWDLEPSEMRAVRAGRRVLLAWGSEPAG